jgi:hypothetical protein
MDEAEPPAGQCADLAAIESRTMGLVQEEGKPGEAGRSCNPRDQSLSPSPPIPGSRGVDTQPKQKEVSLTSGNLRKFPEIKSSVQSLLSSKHEIYDEWLLKFPLHACMSDNGSLLI